MPAGVISGNSNNVTIGGAQVLFDSYDIGITEGDITINRETQVKQGKDGIPLQIYIQVPIEETWKIKVPMVESTAKNIARASSNLVVNTTSATPVVVPFGGTPATSAAFTFASLHGGSVEAIILAGPNVSAITVKNAAEGVTYVANTDYFVDTIKGIIYRLPGGAITSGQTVHVAYTYTLVSLDEILLGVNLALVNKKVEFIHKSPVSGDVFHYCYWKCQGTGNLDLSFKKQDFMIINADLVAIPDAVAHPTCPTGFLRRVPAAYAATYLAGITVAA